MILIVIKKIKFLNESKNNYIIKNFFINFYDIFLFLINYFSIFSLKINSGNILFDKLAKYELDKFYFSEMQFKSFINYIVFKRLKKRGLIIKHFVDW